MSGLFGGGAQPNATTPAKAKGLQMLTASYGDPLPVIYGRNKVSGHVIDYLEFQAHAHQEQQAGGKGGGGSSGVTSYSYSCTFMIALAEGPIHSINGLWDGSTPQTLAKVNAVSFLGTATQNAWSHLTGNHALNYRFTAYVAFANHDLGSSPSLPNYNWDVTGILPFDAGTIDSADPSAIWNDICTSAHHGIGWAFNADLSLWSDYCCAAGIFLSPVYDQQQTSAQTLSDLAKYSNTAPVFSEGVLKMLPYGDQPLTGNGHTYTPDVTPLYDLDDDDFIPPGDGSPPVTLTISRPDDSPNRVLLEVLDQSNQFTPITVEAKDQADIDDRGVVDNGTDNVHQIIDPAMGRFVAQLILQRGLYIRRSYSFRLPWNFPMLEPMDILTLTDSWLGLNKFAVRITEVTESDDGSYLDITVEEFPAGVGHAALYGNQTGEGFNSNLDADPGQVQVPLFARAPGFLVESPEFWIAVAGTTDIWGGCNVYTSYDDETYAWAGRITVGSRYGVLPNGLATSASDPDTTHDPLADMYNGTLAGGSQQDADEFVTAMLVEDEVISYKTATPTDQADQYQLSYLRRGGYNTDVAAHPANAPFMRLDDNLVRVPFDPGSVGKTLYVKFQGFNIWGRGLEDLSEVDRYEYVIGDDLKLPDQPATPESLSVTGVADGIDVSWVNPNPAAVRYSQVRYSTDGGETWTDLDPGNVTSYHHPTLDGSDIYFSVRACGWNYFWSDWTVGEDTAGRIVPGYGDLVFDDLIINGSFEEQTNWTGGSFFANGGYNDSGCYALVAPAGQTAYAWQTDQVGNTRYIRVKPGDRLYMPIRVYRPSGDASYVVQLTGYSADKSTQDFTMQVVNPAQSGGWPITRALFTVPDGVYWIRPAMHINNDGTEDTTVKFDDFELYKNSFSYSNLSPTGVPQGMTYTSDGDSITWSWIGMNLLMADSDAGFSLMIPNGSKTFTGLTSSKTYYGYPYYDLSANVVAWGGNALFANPLSAAGQAATLEQNSLDHIPLSYGDFTAATTSGGSGSGGGGGWQGHPCVTADSLIVRESSSVAIARSIKRGEGLEAWHGGKSIPYAMPVINNPMLYTSDCVAISTGGLWWRRVLHCSTETHFDLRGGGDCLARHMLQREVMTDAGWRRVSHVRPIGVQDVMRISLGGMSYAACTPGGEKRIWRWVRRLLGMRRRRWIVSHNFNTLKP